MSYKKAPEKVRHAEPLVTLSTTSSTLTLTKVYLSNLRNNMNFFRPTCVLAVGLFVCACAVMAQGETINWREVPAVAKYLQNNRLARRMSQGPIGTVIDIIIDIILILIDLILGGNRDNPLDFLGSLTGNTGLLKSFLGKLN